MRKPFSGHSTSPAPVDISVFGEAARRESITLDRAQFAAARALANGRTGIYLVGPAGRGKTWLLNVFAAARPPQDTVRIHWHEFLRDLHDQIRIHRGVDTAVDAILGNADTVCFDELHVNDRADGIYLDHLLRRIAARHKRLIMTSNSLPDDLMPHPLLHKSFLPSITKINNMCRVIELDGGVDYRTCATHRSGFASGAWVHVDIPHQPEHTVVVHGRRLRVWDASPHHLGVRFDDICGNALGATDYLELTRHFSSFCISEVPDLADSERDPALRFLHLIDVLYDANRPTTIESATPREAFGRTAPVPPGTSRMLSRLSSLRSDDGSRHDMAGRAIPTNADGQLRRDDINCDVGQA